MRRGRIPGLIDCFELLINNGLHFLFMCSSSTDDSFFGESWQSKNSTKWATTLKKHCSHTRSLLSESELL
jgi:hypothetical protein